MQLNAIFHRKEPQFEPKRCVVEKVIDLDASEYAAFRRNMLRDQPFISKNHLAMRVDSNGVSHCLLVVGEGCDDGVLVNSEGSDYARYAAFIPGARQLLAAEEQRLEQEFKELMGQVPSADIENAGLWLQHARALAEADAGDAGPAVHQDYCRRLREFCDAFRKIDRLYAETPAEIFNGKAFCWPDQLLPMTDWISNGGDIAAAMEGLRTGGFDPLDYATVGIIADGLEHETANYDFAGIQNAYGLDDNQMPQLLQRLAARPEVGELLAHDNRAAFTLCFKLPEQQQKPLTQQDLKAMHARHILWGMDQPGGAFADFSGCVLSELDFSGMTFCDADFMGATIHQCRMGEASFDGSNFSGAKLRGVTAFEGDFTNVNFTDATLEYCDFTGAEHCGAFFTDVEIVECDGLEGIEQGPAMAMGG